LAVDDKYTPQRQETVAALKKNQGELQKALAASQPDEAKVKELVGAIAGGMDARFNSFNTPGGVTITPGVINTDAPSKRVKSSGRT